MLLLVQISVAHGQQWKTIESDGLHDPTSSAVNVLQDPGEALSVLPPDQVGNQVNWVRALRDGYIKPRNSLAEEGIAPKMLDSVILMTDTGDMPVVRFPHKEHTEWLECGNCHDHLFKSKAGETPVTMLSILQGEYCGRCHGAVSFPLTECKRCHSVTKAQQ